MKKIKTITGTLASIAVMIASSQSVYARQLTIEEAVANIKYNNPISHSSRTSNAELEPVLTFEENGQNTVYVLNRKGGGFVILSADDVASPLLAYSETGAIPTADNAPENLLQWLNVYSREIAAAIESGKTSTTSEPIEGLSEIAPLVKTEWHQSGNPYNSKTPVMTYTNGKTYSCKAGCVALALSQIMRVHQWPEKGIGTHSYTWNGKLLSFDYANTTFDWDNMINEYTGASTAAQQNAVATLLYGVGVAVDMNYGVTASSANNNNALRGLIEYLNYDKGVYYVSRKYYTMEDWVKILHAELSAGCPIYYDGDDQNGSGHAFVIDGYRTDGFFHVNWGEFGYSNGYFKLTAMDISSVTNYNSDQGAFLGLKKPVEGSEYRAGFYIKGNFKARQDQYTRSSNETVRFLEGTTAGQFVVSCVYPIKDITPGLRLVAENGNESYIWTTTTYDELSDGEGSKYLNITATEFPESGTYVVTPAVRWGDKIYDVRVNASKNQSVKLIATALELRFSDVAGIEAIETTGSCSVYPNPASSVAVINASSAIKTVSVYSISGTLATQVQGDGVSSRLTLDVATLPAGTYIVAVNCVDNNFTSRLVKQ